MKLFAGFFIGKNGCSGVSMHAVVIPSHSHEEAFFSAMAMAREKYPDYQGYVGHDAELIEVEQAIIDACATKEGYRQ